MRKILLASAVILPLAGCQATTVPDVSPVVTTVVGVLPEQVQQYAVQACGYLPAAATVIQLIQAFGGPAVPGIATQIAQEVCSAVVKPAARRGAARVRGVPIAGAFVR